MVAARRRRGRRRRALRLRALRGRRADAAARQPVRRRTSPTSLRARARSVGAAALEGGGGGEGEADDDAPLTIEQFRGWYAAYLAEARHVGAPHWRPVLLMMARHGLLRVAGAKKKGSFDGWRRGRCCSRPPASAQ